MDSNTKNQIDEIINEAKIVASNHIDSSSNGLDLVYTKTEAMEVFAKKIQEASITGSTNEKEEVKKYLSDEMSKAIKELFD